MSSSSRRRGSSIRRRTGWDGRAIACVLGGCSGASQPTHWEGARKVPYSLGSQLDQYSTLSRILNMMSAFMGRPALPLLCISVTTKVSTVTPFQSCHTHTLFQPYLRPRRRTRRTWAVGGAGSRGPRTGLLMSVLVSHLIIPSDRPISQILSFIAARRKAGPTPSPRRIASALLRKTIVSSLLEQVNEPKMVISLRVRALNRSNPGCLGSMARVHG